MNNDEQQNKALFFYQSAIVVHVKVDHSNPLHAELLSLFEPRDQKIPAFMAGVRNEHIAKATKLMKKIEGFRQSTSLTNTPAWASDVFLRLLNVDEDGNKPLFK